jgi:hypothetical protein
VIRTLLILAAAAAFFLAGYWAGEQYEARRIWREDRTMDRPAAEITEPAQELVAPRDCPIQFEDVAAAWGLDFVYYDGAAGEFYLFETTGGGMALLDFDQDGYQDLYLVNGSRVPADSSDRSHTSRLFRNVNERGLEDHSVPAGVDLVVYGQGASAADYDNDGFDDLLVTSFGRNVLFHNNGDGSLCDVSESSGVAASLWSTSAAFSDLDSDGDLDLYICTYADVPLENPLVCERSGRRMHCLPSRYRAQPDLLYRNGGDGSFLEASEAAGALDEHGRGLGVAIGDLAGDERPDIFVANDLSENFLFVNQGQFRFEDRALRLGAALTGDGSTMAGMGVACADYDGNGYLDIVVTNFYAQQNALFHNLGPSGFRDNADAAGLGDTSRDRLGFGTVFLDADLDRSPDLFVANGHVSNMTHVGVPYKMRQQLYWNRGGRFHEVSDSCGTYFRQNLLGRGVAAGDLNNDGLPDMVASHILDRAAVLLNRTVAHGHWLGLELVGARSNRNGTNVQVTIQLGGEKRRHETIAGAGYLSSSDKRLLIGLGPADQVESLSVRWPSGHQQQLVTPAIDRYHRVVEGLD